jgi:asparagine synthase (glutamine-hydrolysing)
LKSDRKWEVDKLRDLLTGDLTTAGVTRSLRRLLPNTTIESMLNSPGAEVLAHVTALHGQSGTMDGFNEVSSAELEYYMANTLLRDSDIHSMAHSVELRVPYLDLPIVNYVCSLKGVAKTAARGGVKPVLRSAFAGELPEHLLRRQKTGFTLPMWSWMIGPLREQCEEAIGNLERCALFDPAVVRNTWTSYVENASRMHWSRPMALVSLGAYLR